MYTSLDFTSLDICPYVIVTDSDITFNTKISITLSQIKNTDVYLLTGTSMDSITSELKLAVDQYILSSEKYYILILKPTTD